MDLSARRQTMVAQLRAAQNVSDRVAEAMLAVPRHLFVPGVKPEDAYRDEPIVTKLDAGGRPISSSSQPAIMATMLDQLGVRPGHRVLEIGAGTGYNAALLAYLTGPDGQVVSLDIDEDTVAQAREHLSEAGRPEVVVARADGAGGFPDLAPYDRVIATVGVWDLAPAWLAQLRRGGRLVVPLDLRGVQVSVAMERGEEPFEHVKPGEEPPARDEGRDEGRGDGRGDGRRGERGEGRWVSRSVAPCGFMRMRGPFAGTETSVVVRREPEVLLALPQARELGDLGDLAAALDTAPVEITAGTAGQAPPFVVGMGVALWLALHEPRWCAVSGDFGGGHGFTAGLVEDGAIALLAVDGAVVDGSVVDGSVVARGHGSSGARLAADLAAHIRAWYEAGRPEAADLRIEASTTPRTGPDERVIIGKRHTTLALSFSRPSTRRHG